MNKTALLTSFIIYFLFAVIPANPVATQVLLNAALVILAIVVARLWEDLS